MVESKPMGDRNKFSVVEITDSGLVEQLSFGVRVDIDGHSIAGVTAVRIDMVSDEFAQVTLTMDAKVNIDKLKLASIVVEHKEAGD